MIIQDRCFPMIMYKMENGRYHIYSSKKKKWVPIETGKLLQSAIDLSNSYSDCRVISEEEAREVIEEYWL